jgi:hypothetical protein
MSMFNTQPNRMAKARPISGRPTFRRISINNFFSNPVSRTDVTDNFTETCVPRA